MLRTGLNKIFFLEHVTYYNQKTLGLLLKRNGFEPIRFFLSETDLAKYRLRPLERLSGILILGLARLFRAQNRLLVVARKVERRKHL